jgi:L,D-transpeptidase YcbB
MSRLCRPLAIVPALLTALSAVAAHAAVPDEIQRVVERERRFQHADTIGDWYANRNFEPAWVEGTALTSAGESAVAVLRAYVPHGIDPDIVHADVLNDLWNDFEEGRYDDARAAEFDAMISDALLSLAHELYYDNSANRPAEVTTAQEWRAAAYSPLLDACTVDCEEAFQPLWPAMVAYVNLAAALERYRALQAQGGWPELELEVEPGSEPSLILGLRARLALEGYIQDVATDVWDEALSAAVRRYQDAHHISPPVDRVGPSTLRSLNTPIEERLAAIVVTMDHLRESGRGTQGRGESIWVNVAGFSVEVWEDTSRLFRTRAIVGSTSDRGINRTPLFADELERIEINPIWYPPARLARQLRLSREDGIVRRNGRIIQLPGPGNPMGRVKFLFPNHHAVYLHDTSNPRLFERTVRAFSSGCIRTDRPLELATLLISRDQGRDPEEVSAWIDGILQTDETEVVPLQQVLPVYVEYFTVWVADDEIVEFYGDIYGYDRAAVREVSRRRDVALP